MKTTAYLLILLVFLPSVLGVDILIYPRTRDVSGRSVIEEFHAYGHYCKSYSITNYGNSVSVVTTSKQGFTYTLDGYTINSKDLFTVDNNQLYLMPNSTTTFKICTNHPPGSYEGDVIINAGDYTDKIMVFMEEPPEEYVDKPIIETGVWQSPKSIGGKFLGLDVKSVLFIAVSLMVLTFIIFFTIKRRRRK